MNATAPGLTRRTLLALPAVAGASGLARPGRVIAAPSTTTTVVGQDLAETAAATAHCAWLTDRASADGWTFLRCP
ncbi:hypothetical protein [Streptomyces sp. NBC_00582]|uniref:hypothetical protein n=1 Tax=Streptomyces sp. NBC_00582 TaxID=2975783 RepID=UPI002E7FE0B7|nr:hypothetical protein [Streptomyces sp. NBC_00582]WUB66880.1 hypothetical protein OG852_43990 [Streptomyces sp. NBC_00582]